MSVFRGGIHPWEGKDLAKAKPIVKISPGEELVFPMSQHIGAPAVPVVQKGDTVKMGQLIGKAAGFVSANVVSSVSGTVKAIEPRILLNGSHSLCVIVENDGLDTPEEGLGEKREFQKMNREEILQAISQAGIVGMGGACFPAHVKLSVKDPDAVEYVLVNGSECEPYLTSDYRIMLERPETVLLGLHVILSLFPNAKGIICIEKNKPLAIDQLARLSASYDRIQVLPTRTRYPQGAERMLIYTATGRKINSSMLPIDAGCIVHNIDTVAAIFYAVCESIPLMRRIITVTGDAVVSPGNFEVRLGTSLGKVVAEAGGFAEKPEKIIAGGPMMGHSLASLEVSVTKNATAVTAFLKDPVPDIFTPCIRCGRCVAHCPEGLLPQKLAAFAEQQDYEAFAENYGMECFSCGCCSYSCPAKRPLTQLITAARAHCLQLRKNAQGGK